jgi:hypothetical protein
MAEMSKGWQIVQFQMDRDQASNLTLMMGTIYLTYSAYFLAIDFAEIQMFMKIILAVMYGVMGFNNLRSIKQQILKVQLFTVNIIQENQEDVMREALFLKI